MKHNKLIAALAAVGGAVAMGSAHAIAPALVGLAALAGGATAGAALTHDQNNPPPAVAVVPSSPTVIMGAPPAPVQEVIPAPRDGYQWEQGRYELQNGASVWVPGHWVANDTVIIQHD